MARQVSVPDDQFPEQSFGKLTTAYNPSWNALFWPLPAPALICTCPTMKTHSTHAGSN